MQNTLIVTIAQQVTMSDPMTMRTMIIGSRPLASSDVDGGGGGGGCGNLGSGRSKCLYVAFSTGTPKTSVASSNSSSRSSMYSLGLALPIATRAVMSTLAPAAKGGLTVTPDSSSKDTLAIFCCSVESTLSG